jgi:molybdopterin-guanine dinucleotide biosynthesis protein A
MAHDGELTVVILAGGQAARFPGKLEARLNGRPLLARVHANLRDAAPVVIAGRDTFSPDLDSLLDCPIVVDRWPGRGPLAGLLSACTQIRTPLVFAVAGDAPRVDRRVLDALLAARHDGDEAVVPEHDGSLEPLAALYDRAALEREAWSALDGRASMFALLERLRVRTVALDAHFFANINTAADLAMEGSS